MKNTKIVKTLAFIICVSLIIPQTVFAVDSGYYDPSHRASTTPETKHKDNNNVEIDKSAKWTQDRDGEIEITVNGTENIISSTEAVDILFITDVSGSVARADLNTNHVRYFTNQYHEGGGGTTNLDFTNSHYITGTVTNILDNAVSNGAITDYKSWTVIDKDLLIQIPSSYYGEETPNDADLWMFPITTKVNAVTAYANWGIVDFNATEGDNDYLADFKTADAVPGLMCEVKYDANGMVTDRKRLSYEVTKVDSIYNGGDSFTVNSIVNSNCISFNADDPNSGAGYPFDTYSWKSDMVFGSKPGNKMIVEAIKKISDEVLTKSPDSNFAFAPFGTAANTGYNDEPNSHPFTNDQTAISENIELIYRWGDGETNYEAGWISGQNVYDEWMTNGEGKDNGNKKLIIFITDGYPTRMCDNNDETTNIRGTVDEYLAAAVAVKDKISNKYPDTLFYSLGYNMLPENGEPAHVLSEFSGANVLNLEDFLQNDNPFENSIMQIYNEESKSTRLLSVTDIISFDFNIDKEELKINKDKYMPDYCTYQLGTKTSGGRVYDQIQFDFNIENSKTTEKVRIPIILKDECEPNNDIEVPTNFDSDNSGGAYAHYINLGNEDSDVNTMTPYLPVEKEAGSTPKNTNPGTDNDDGGSAGDHDKPVGQHEQNVLNAHDTGDSYPMTLMLILLTLCGIVMIVYYFKKMKHID